MHKKSILRKTIQVGFCTLMSRFLGIVRESLQVRFIGPSLLSDAFVVAYRLPNSLRKIFAEGALTAAFIPNIVRLLRKKKRDELSSLMTFAFLFFEGILLIICAVIMFFAPAVVRFLGPGFSSEQIVRGAGMVRILMPFIFFLSASSLLAGPLQAINHFLIPALSPVLLNIVYIIGLLVCMAYQLPIEGLCFFILVGGALQFLMHLVAYFYNHFSFSRIKGQFHETWSYLRPIVVKVLFCLPAMSVMEINMIVDGQFASFLPAGSITLLYYANRFMGIPLGVFALAFSTILLPHFSRIGEYAPKRLQFYVLESAKFIFWVTIPIMLMMIFFADKIFYTIFYSKKFTLAHVAESRLILIAFVSGLFFLAFNRVLLNFYYARHVTWLPGIIATIGAAINIALDFVFIKYFQAMGLALGTTIAGAIQTVLFVLFLHLYFDLTIYIQRFLSFAFRYLIQILFVFTIFYGIYVGLVHIIGFLPEVFANFFINKIGIWLWVGPLCLGAFGVLYITRRFFGIKLYFLD